VHVARHERDAEVLPLGNVLEPQDESVALLLVIRSARVVCQVVLELGLAVPGIPTEKSAKITMYRRDETDGTHALNLLTPDGMTPILASTVMGLSFFSSICSSATMRGYAIGTPAGQGHCQRLRPQKLD
jgi:hypothetical protein